MERTRWYKDAVFYQIWPRSFCDGNGDGIGDLWGVLEKLDYIASLGVTGIWFSPLYPSPNADFGYDIADYRSINPEYGDIDVFRRVLEGAHERGLKVIMDLVVNHTSSEHPWFRESRSSKSSPYHDYYIWRAGGEHAGVPTPPNNWDSLFEGRAWEYEPALDEWYLHIFATGQPDLNMDNPRVRAEVEEILRFWLDLGVDGFREDVITFTGKAEGLPDDHLMVPGARGLRFYENGPRVHEFLVQFRDNVLAQYDCMTVGEAPLITPGKALLFIEEGPDQTLDLMFHFEHMGADCLFTDYVPLPFSLRRLKAAFGRWQRKLDGRAWNALYLENHDHPRIVSRYSGEAFREKSAMMLACSYLFQKGTPFVYQGQEIGMVNTRFTTIGEKPVRQAHRCRRYTREGHGAREPCGARSCAYAHAVVGWDAGGVLPGRHQVVVCRESQPPYDQCRPRRDGPELGTQLLLQGDPPALHAAGGARGLIPRIQARIGRAVRVCARWPMSVCLCPAASRTMACASACPRATGSKRGRSGPATTNRRASRPHRGQGGLPSVRVHVYCFGKA